MVYAIVEKNSLRKIALKIRKRGQPSHPAATCHVLASLLGSSCCAPVGWAWFASWPMCIWWTVPVGGIGRWLDFAPSGRWIGSAAGASYPCTILERFPLSPSLLQEREAKRAELSDPASILPAPRLRWRLWALPRWGVGESAAVVVV